MIFFENRLPLFGIVLTGVALAGAPPCFGWMSVRALPAAAGVAPLP
jgi:hypothetical protein